MTRIIGSGRLQPWYDFIVDKHPVVESIYVDGRLFEFDDRDPHDGFRNVVRHNVVVGVSAHLLACGMKLSAAEIETITVAASGHDAGKRLEIEYVNAQAAEHGPEVKGQAREEYVALDQKWLESFIGPELAHLTHSNVLPGIRGQSEYALIVGILHRSLPEQVVHFCDMIAGEEEIDELRQPTVEPWETRLLKVEQKPGTMDFLESFAPNMAGRDLNFWQRTACTFATDNFAKRIGICRTTLIDWINAGIDAGPDALETAA